MPSTPSAASWATSSRGPVGVAGGQPQLGAFSEDRRDTFGRTERLVARRVRFERAEVACDACACRPELVKHCFDVRFARRGADLGGPRDQGIGGDQIVGGQRVHRSPETAKNAALAEPDSSARISSARSWRCTATMSRHSHAVVRRHRCAERRRSGSGRWAATSSSRAARLEPLGEVVGTPVGDQGGIQRVGRSLRRAHFGSQPQGVVRKARRSHRVVAVRPGAGQRRGEPSADQRRVAAASRPRATAPGSARVHAETLARGHGQCGSNHRLPSPAARAAANAATSDVRMASTSPERPKCGGRRQVIGSGGRGRAWTGFAGHQAHLMAGGAGSRYGRSSSTVAR